MARASSRSKPRRFGISSRKSVSAAASQLRDPARARPLELAPQVADGRARLDAAGRTADASGADWPGSAGAWPACALGRALERLALASRPLLAFAALALFGFFMGILLNEGLPGFTKTG